MTTNFNHKLTVKKSLLTNPLEDFYSQVELCRQYELGIATTNLDNF